jgi:hypothetical protein
MDDADRRNVRRLALFTLSLLVATAAISALVGLYSRKFYDLTGEAQWIWPQHELSRNIPVAFFAVKTFDLPPSRLFTRIKIAGDPEYTLYFNGAQVGGRRVGDERRLDVYDVSALARDRANRIVVAVRSVNGVGGLLASVDIAPESENFVVTDRSWRVTRRWDDALPLREVAPGSEPMSLGEPPVVRWNYLTRTASPNTEALGGVIDAKSQQQFKGMLPEIRVAGGVAVEAGVPVRATLFDFGPTHGRVRLNLQSITGVPPVVNVRLANSLEETSRVDWQIRPFVFASGETTLTDPEAFGFRYVVVYGGRATAQVVTTAR